jgi:acetyltransferase-like isoleucine patch superfamily enzyme
MGIVPVYFMIEFPFLTVIIVNLVEQFLVEINPFLKSFPLDEDGKPIKGIPRHPILEDNVIVYSNATILGRITIGKNATVGGNIWVTEDVPAGARIVQTKAKK